MKINKLTIKNIFSIEDETIDFAAEPLASTDVFLITGPTGAGKTTIFDAICLALYCKTPRMSTLKMQGAFAEGKKNIQVDDCRQYLRKGTGAGWVELSFVGNDGQTYIAKWSVHRSDNKPDGVLQSKQWTLSTPNGTFDKDKDIAPVILKAVGLDFDQFCRTTMLAQGAFTEFLDSEDDQKAAILEKITGLSDYSKIGCRLFEETKKREQAFTDQKKEIEKTKTLDDSVLKDYNKELASLNAEDVTIESEKKILEDSLAWLNDLAKAKTDLEEKEQAYKVASDKLSSPSFKAEQDFLSDWQKSIAARSALSAFNAASVQIASQKAVLDAKQKETLSILAGQKWLDEQIKAIEKEIADIDGKVKPFEAKANAYSNVQTITNALSTYMSNSSAVASNQQKIDDEEKNIKNNLQPDFDGKKKSFDQKEAEYNKADEELAKLDKEVADLKLNDKRNQVSDLNLKLRDIKDAGDRLTDYSNARISFDKQSESLKERKAKIEDAKEVARKTNDSLVLAKNAIDLAKANYDIQINSEHKWAKAMRSQFKSGCTCPVCRQTVTTIPNEADIDKEAANAFDKWKDLQEKYDDQKAKYDTFVAQIKADEKSYNDDKMKHDNDSSETDAEGRLKALCDKLDIVFSLDNLNQLSTDLDAAKATTDKQITSLGVAIKKGEEQELAARDKQKVVKNLREAKETAEKDMREAEDAIRSAKSRIDGFKSAIETANSNINSAKSTITPLVEGLSWSCNWFEQPEMFSTLISGEAEQYNDWKSTQEEDKRRQGDFQRDFKEVSDTLDAIMELEPDWKELPVGQSAEVKEINRKANNVKTSVSEAKNLIISAEKQISDNKQLLDAFYAANPSINESRLKELDLCPQEDKAKRDKDLSDIKSDANGKKTLFEDAEKKLKELNNNPKAKPEDTVESLTDLKTQKDQRIKVISARKAEIGGELDRNKKVLEQLGKSEVKLKELKADFEKWNALKLLIGDAKGDVFRRIAQSYVLANVVEAANTYMQTLTNRYKLDVEPGTLIINVEDSYQGYAQRASSTISGGEKFIVSLALALGLSSMANGLSVDMLFIDEGFGTLSGQELNNAINTLRSLHRANKQVAIISHVQSLEENIDVQIQLEKNETTASSKIKIVSNKA